MRPRILVDIQTAADTLGIGGYAAGKRAARGRLPVVQPAGRGSRRLVPLEALGPDCLELELAARRAAAQAGLDPEAVTCLVLTVDGERRFEFIPTEPSEAPC